MDSWPSTLPQNLLAGASIGDDESRLISQMDAGPASVRNRFTAVPQPVKGNMILTGVQISIFNNFLRTTLQHGALPFSWINPETNDSVTFRFKTKPTWQCIRGSSDINSRIWQGSLDLEILP